MVKSIAFFLLVAFSCKDVLCIRQENRGKIVGGNETTIQTYPYQAYLLLYDGSDDFQCGGAIVSQNYIVTAAHCLKEIENITVRIGSTDFFSGGLLYETTTFYSHPLYDDTISEYDYDVGVVRVSQGMDLDGTNAKTIEMVAPDSDVPDDETIVLTSASATSEDSPTNTLMFADVPAVNREECNEYFGNITTRVFCVGVPEDAEDVCQEDSGGPAVTKTDGLLAGIVSFSDGCDSPNSPVVCTRIGDPSIRSFIDEIMAN